MLGQSEKVMNGREEAMSEQLQELGGRKQKLKMDQAAFDQARQNVQEKQIDF